MGCNERRILGIDPGTIRMGYALLQETTDIKALDWGVITQKPSIPIEYRLYQLHTHILSLISLWQPHAIAVEEPFMGKGEHQFVRSSFAIGQAQALVLIAAAGHSIPLFKYSPSQVKRAVTNYGAAHKDQVKDMVQIMLDINLSDQPSDVSDALAIGLCHIQNQNMTEVLAKEIL